MGKAVGFAKYILFALACPLAGCAGFAADWIGSDEAAVTNPILSHKNERGYLEPVSHAIPKVHADELRKSWGPPDKLSRLDRGGELWRYDFGLRWNGAYVLVLIVPLPLLVPVGYEYVEFTVENNLVTRVDTKEHNTQVSVGCVVAFVGHYSPGCFKDRKGTDSRFFGGPPPGGFKP